MFGKVDPERLDANWNLPREIPGFDPAARIRQALDGGDVYEALEREKPDHPYYTALKRELARYQQIERAGGWPSIPAGSVLRVGATDDACQCCDVASV